ncbi:MAG: LacI family transcriptional regulator [Lachnospiraceae bacterium]|nr:LacI family transcriptional regulator [Lachnospiraceae bacterium]
MTTMKDIANRLGISISTVSKGLNGAHDISEHLRQAVLNTAAEMGYQTKKMKQTDYKKLCLFIQNMRYESPMDFGYDIILGFKQAAFRDRWNVDIIPATSSLQKSESYDIYMLKNGYNGAFFVGFSLQDEWLAQLTNTNIPTVLFDNHISRNPWVASIGSDNEEGIDAAIEHLYQLGHRKIAFLNGPIYSMISQKRNQAFLNSLKKYNLTIYQDFIIYGDFSFESAKKYIPHFLKNDVTGILCSSDMIARGAITECQNRGYRIPEDISIIGFDDLPISSTLDPLLTTIRQNRLILGRTGYFSLNSMLHGVSLSQTLLHPELIVRASTAKCSQAPLDLE